MAEQRIQKVLSDQGVCSRRAAEKLIDEGRVKVNGHPVTLGDKMDPDFDKVSIDGKSVRIVRKRQYTYLMLNKPRGYITTASDERGRKTVMDLLTGVDRRVYPIGRLDKDSEGLLLLTDDGALGHALTSPKHAVDKVYRAQTEGALGDTDVQAFAQGITLRDGTRCRPAKLEICEAREGYAEVLLTVQEGKYHQVRRMLASRDAPVKTLERLSEGPLKLDAALQPGQWRELTQEEIAQLLACQAGKDG